jgi:hypothetical protein
VRRPHDRDHHHPSRLIRGVAVALAALASAAPAAADGHFAALPSPVAPLSPAPPLGGGAAASAESTRHRVDARQTVRIGVDASGTPFRVVATQRLDVRVLGDYFFTIGAPALDVFRAGGSTADPGFRTGAVIWQGFDPGRRILAARVVLDTAQVEELLPLRISVARGRTVLTNATGLDVGAFAADAERGPLRAYLARLRGAIARGAEPVGGSIVVTTSPVATRLRVVAPLQVEGTIGGRRVSLILRDRAVVPAVGTVRLTVTPEFALDTAGASSLDGRRLLALVMRATLTVARTRQYQTFLGNPDPTGRSETTYVFRTARRVAPAPVPPSSHSHSPVTALVALLGTALALAAAVVLWARS